MLIITIMRDLAYSHPHIPSQVSGYLRSDKYMTEKTYNSAVKKCGVIPVHLPGILATWSPKGNYMPPCLLDYCRFRSLRPPRAEMLDQNDWTKDEQNECVIKKGIWGSDSCAEWAAFLQLANVLKDEVSVTEASSW